jgi:hypothetical protein
MSSLSLSKIFGLHYRLGVQVIRYDPKSMNVRNSKLYLYVNL